MHIEKGRVHAPEIGQTWLNSPGLSIRGLRGKVVLIDFWDYTCINCLRTLPYVIEWDRRYREKALVIVGVHAPEFQFARTAEHVRAAVEELGIRYPVVLDNDFIVWQSFANKCWPAKYLIDKDGYVRFFVLGEGGYDEMEEAIQLLLREVSPEVELPAIMVPLRPTDRPGARCYRPTPELYLGHARGRIGNAEGFSPDAIYTYSTPEKMEPDLVYLVGPWLAREEFAQSAAHPAEAPPRLLLQYTAKEVNLVMSPTGEPPARLNIRQDGKPLGEPQAGTDVRIEGGQSHVLIDKPRMYNLVSNAGFESHSLELEPAAAGLALYAFTFVTCVEEEREY